MTLEIISKRLALFILIFAFGQTSFSQSLSDKKQSEIDRLNRIIDNSTTADTTKAAAYMDLAGILYMSNIDTVFHFCKKIQDVCNKRLKEDISSKERRSLLESLSGSYNNEGYVYFQSGDRDNALKKYTEGLLIQQTIGDFEGLALSLNNMGQVYNANGEIQNALDFYNKSRIIQEQYDLKKGLAITLNNIGLMYRKQNDLDKAYEYYMQSLALREELDDKIGIAGSYNNIGSLFKFKGDPETALMYHQKSLDIRLQINDKQGLANSYNNLGGIYADIGENENALEYYKQALVLREENNFKTGISESLIGIATVYHKQGYKKAALQTAEQSLAVAQEIGYPQRIDQAAELLTEIHRENGNYKSALEMHELHILMRDSISNNDVNQASIELEAKYEYDKQKVADDAEHEKQLLYEQEEQQKQEIISWAISVGAILLAGFLIFVFQRLKVTRRQKDEINNQKQKIEETHSELAEKNKEILDSINYAKRIQSAILPPDESIHAHLKNAFVYYAPKDIVAGDFYWLELRENKVLFAAADCTGHGVPGALVSVICNNALNRSVREFGLTEPGEILGKAREIVIQEFEKSAEEVKDGMDIALCSIEPIDGTQEAMLLKYAGANNPLWIIRDEKLMETKANKQPIGKFDELKPYDTHEIRLQKNDLIYVFSDGFADQFGGPKGKKYKSENFKRLLLKHQGESIKGQHQLLKSEIERWMGDLDQLDDICIIGMRI